MQALTDDVRCACSTRGTLLMGWRTAIEFLSLFTAGLLAGEELVIRYGVRDAIGTLDDAHAIALRQALIYRLRVLVPAIFVPTLTLAVTTGIVEGTQHGVVLRWIGIGALVGWGLLTAFGTVPINAAAFDWRPDAPPSDWRSLVERWERMNTIRAWLAVAGFACLLAGTGLSFP
jgi:uncharacterized membrane protein